MGQDRDTATSRFFQWTKLHKSELIKRWQTKEIVIVKKVSGEVVEEEGWS